MEAVNLLSSNKYTEKQIVRIDELFSSLMIEENIQFILGLFIYFCHHEFKYRNETINYTKYS